ncbi:hypothetical protein KQI42_06520 [Tissierella sp. MSJ-40]|uniref:Tyr recombinase domain-containing protein n=1 Tax=Tissierella simiarum TaxID=2841534 RepID=A0ABS6E4F9_9FIRM|nr:hypothetical protein [Tissierella simiarum]MBU5437652.1 hypothetical protein [Tissierella simiarum]
MQIIEKDDKIKTLTNSELNNLLNKITNKKYYIATLIAEKADFRLEEILRLT